MAKKQQKTEKKSRDKWIKVVRVKGPARMEKREINEGGEETGKILSIHRC